MSTANEPAYPTPDSGGHWTNPETGYTGYQNPGQPGMTKREMIAMHALQGITAGAYCGGGFMEVHVKYAVEYADALLVELERTEKT